MKELSDPHCPGRVQELKMTLLMQTFTPVNETSRPLDQTIRKDCNILQGQPFFTSWEHADYLQRSKKKKSQRNVTWMINDLESLKEPPAVLDNGFPFILHSFENVFKVSSNSAKSKYYKKEHKCICTHVYISVLT